MSSISVMDIKQHLNIDAEDDADDTMLTAKIDAAQQWIEKFIGTPIAEIEGQPAPVLEAMRILVGHLYENREATLVGVSAEMLPFGVFDLLAPYRSYVF
ncbi:phage gp6-like head-tail connector protein [Rhizobium sp. P32RR-XVIII]|uniref:head-tail connector protein n=1 Tax=Rhizobium sp. P32RR-XVIII TaxID=2726738 RepID=UPI001456A8EF|nr:head-tail connector protein [Rhizobium sp. P32RR-XVIII]NLS04613.1 phage gp6-like head-tail connector protein [Rhizobium sp. P32RR-XVIII]